MTLGFGEILRVILQQTRPVIDDAAAAPRGSGSRTVFPPPVGGAVGFNGLPKYTNLFWVYTFVTVMLVVAFRLKRSSLGRAMISVREDEFAAQSMGVNVARVKVLAFMMAAFFAGMAGGLYAHQVGNSIRPPDAGFQRSLDYVLMTVLGGRGSITGVMLAAILLTVLAGGAARLRSVSADRLRAVADRHDAACGRRGCSAFTRFGIFGRDG